MTKMTKTIMLSLFLCLLITSFTIAADKKHKMDNTDKVGDLIHKSKVDGYTFEYYFMDMRNKKTKGHDMGHGSKEMDKPHHLMLYIMDSNHNQIMKGKVGFMIKGTSGEKQKAMGMFMSNGFKTNSLGVY